MSTSLLEEIPRRLINNLLHASSLPLNNRERCVLLLTKNLQFFEVKSLEITFGIDLSDTILKGVNLPDFVSVLSHRKESGQSSQSLDDLKIERNDVKFGKYIYSQESIKHLFILINVLDKLIVLERCLNGYKLIEQYENVGSFGIVDPNKALRPKVVVNFNDGRHIQTMFVNVNSAYGDKSSDNNNLEENEVFKALLAKVKRAKVELSAHKLTTHREFLNLKNTCVFGPNYIRSANIEEKQPLGKYGDVWMKLFNDYLIIGIPVINNCSKRPTTLQNIRLTFIRTGAEIAEYECTLYQLKDNSFTYENFDELFENNTPERSFQFQKEWLPIKTRILQPECSGVIVLRMKWEIDLSCRAYNYLCFILYDIISKERKFTLQYHIQDIVIGPDILLKDEHQIKFESNKLYQDLLAVTFTSFYKALQIEFESEDFFVGLCNFLMCKLGFTCIKKAAQNTEPMEVDDTSYQRHSAIFNNGSTTEEMYLHKENSCSYWYGTLIRLRSSSKNIISVKLYTRSEEKVLTLTQLLYKEFPKECKVLPISCTSQQSGVKLRHFEDTLRQELHLATKFCQENANKKELKRSDIYKFQQELLARELETDLAAANIM